MLFSEAKKREDSKWRKRTAVLQLVKADGRSYAHITHLLILYGKLAFSTNDVLHNMFIIYQVYRQRYQSSKVT